jgi:cytochrome c-type biogenesis protein CcmH/NrfG
LREAQQESEQALQLDKNEATWWEIAGRVKAAMNQPSQARALFDKAAQLAPKRAGAIYVDLAAALAARNDPKLAGDIEAALKLAASADPPSPEALFQLGQGYANAGKAEGKVYLQKYLDASNKLPEAERDPQKMQVAKQMIRALDILNSTRK